MTISRVPTKWKDKKLNYPSSQYPQSKNTDLPKHFSVICIVGSRGSGKTALVTRLLNQYEGTVVCPKSNCIMDSEYVVCSPTIHQNEAYFSVLTGEKHMYSDMNDEEIHAMTSRIDNEKLEWEEYDHYNAIYKKILKSSNPDKYIASLDPVTRNYFEKNDFNPPERPRKNRYVTYMICDDVVGTDLLSSRKTHGFKNLVIKSRHHGIIVILCVQALKEVPKSIRMNVSCFCLGKYAQPKIVTEFHEECCGDVPFGDFERMYNDVHQNDFSFLCIDHSKPKKDRFSDSFRYKLVV